MDQATLKTLLDFVAQVGAPTALAVGGMFLLYRQNLTHNNQTALLAGMTVKLDGVGDIKLAGDARHVLLVSLHAKVDELRNLINRIIEDEKR